MPDLTLIFIVTGVSLLTSFLCSLAEAAIYSISQSRVETLRRSGDRRGETLSRLRAHIDETIVAILVVNTTANTAGAAWAGALVREHYGNQWLGWFSALFTAAILFFSEITPKSLGVRFAAFLGPLIAPPLQALLWLLWPVVKISVLLTRPWNRRPRGPLGTEEDIISLAQLVLREGEIHHQEAEWVANALRLNNVTAYDLMTPSPVVRRVPENMSLRETRINADPWRFSRIPVHAPDNPDRIVGVVRRRKVFNALAGDEFDRRMGDLMDKAEFVPETLPANELLNRFLDKRRHLFCVADENNHFTGVVTLEDVMEHLLGRQIVDETDLHEDMQAVAFRRKEELLARRRRNRNSPATPKP